MLERKGSGTKTQLKMTIKNEGVAQDFCTIVWAFFMKTDGLKREANIV